MTQIIGWALGAIFIASTVVALVVLVVVLVSWWNHVPTLREAAAELGLELLDSDALALADIPEVSRPEPGKHTRWYGVQEWRTDRFENVVSGTWRGLEVRIFEFRSRRPDDDGDLSWWYSCAASRRPTGIRGASVESLALLGHYNIHVQGRTSPYLHWGWPEAAEPALKEWLSNLEGEWGFRIDHPWVFCYVMPQTTSAEKMTHLLEMLDGFIERMPKRADEPELGPGRAAAG